jgi:cytidyltransferase-like protein
MQELKLATSRVCYLGSFDPIHLSHVSTALRAEELFNEGIVVVVCRNQLKDAGFFSLEERVSLVRSCLPLTPILTAANYHDIREVATTARVIVRGRRDEADVAYFDTILKFYSLEHLREKVIHINVPEHLREISSSKAKDLFMKNDVSKLRHMVREDIVNAMKKKSQAFYCCDE